MKKQLITIAVALLTAGALNTSCSSEDNVANEPQTQQPAGNTITLTATLAPKGDNGGTTRAITPGTDANSKEILNVAWAANEKIALYYQTGATSYAKATATVQSVDATTHVATIEATLTGSIDGGTVKFVYPASLANDTGDDIDESKLMTQYGKIDGIANSISKKFDAATGTGKIKLNGGTALPTTATVTNTAGTGNVSLQNRVCICKFHLTVYTIGVNGTIATYFSELNDDLTINDGNGHTYTIKSTKDWPGDVAPGGVSGNPGYATGDDIYVAMLPVENKSLTLSATYTANSVTKNLTLTTKPGTLEAGKFYRNVPVTMQLENMDITGDITTTLTVPDGMTVTVNGANINTTSAAAIVLGEGSKLILKGTNTVRATLANAIQCNGKATIEFQSATNNITVVTNGTKDIQIADGQSLNITGSGSASLSGNIGVPASASLMFNGQAASHDIYIPNGATISGSGVGIGSTVTIANGATFTLSMTTISVTSGPGIQCSGNATIILDGTNTITTTAENYPAIQPGGSGTTLTIQGTGSLTANATGDGAAGIGSGYQGGTSYAGINCGNIIIESGTVTATGKSTGIGSGNYGICGDITISGGTVTAKGNGQAAGIGSGYNASCGDITISGGTVTAIGGAIAAGIGTGAGFNNTEDAICGDITISGGTVTAEGNGKAAGIGSGNYGKFGNISITEGITSVTATAGWYSTNPIGKGKTDGGSGSVSIDGTTAWTAGTATEHFNWAVSTVKDIYTNTTDVTRWTLTHK